MEGRSVAAPSLGGRFEVVRELGRGGMGIVYEAIDRQWGLRVALKTLPGLDAAALLRLKNEFRAVQLVRHPNLLGLGELLEEEGHWLFTMELVDGVDFVRWVRPDGALDEARLRAALPQLCSALHALHAAGIVHRDVKPPNVLVTPAGRVVLLDFGLVTRVAADDALTGGMVIGTAAYMAPEQAAGEPVATAADWYAVGAVLYEALVGRVPFEGPPPVVIETKLRRDPPAPSTMAAVPRDLETLCLGLIARDVERRLDWRQIAPLVGLLPSPSPLGALEPPFVGRARELAELERAFADSARGNVTVFVHGESGIGKSTLVQQLVNGLRERGDVLVLQGQASDRELVPFNGFDGVIDALARQLTELADGGDAAALVPDGPADLTALFPVLSHARGFQRPAPPTGAKPLQRARAFAALRALFAALARRRRLVVVIDDFQWADDDTLALGRALMDGPATPGWLLVAVLRAGADARAVVRRALAPIDGAAAPGDVRHLFVEPLAPAEARALVHELAGDGADTVEAIVRDAGGHPLFLTQMARAHASELGAAADLRATIRQALATLSPAAQRLMQVVAASGRPIRQSLAAPAAELDGETYLRAADELRARGLTRTVGAGLYAAIAPYHDQIAEAIVGELDDGQRAALHRRLAETLEGGAGAEPRTLFLHWLAAGDRQRAARAAAAVAEEAEQKLAFEQAAHYWGRAIELGGDRRTLLPRQASALADGGRKREAVAAYQAAAAIEPDEATRLRHLHAAAEVLLGNGDIDEGVALLRRVLRAIDMPWPRTQLGVIASLVLQRARLRLRGLHTVERPASAIAPRTLVRIDVASSTALALSLVDRARGAYFQTRSVLLALDTGEPHRVARAIVQEAVFSAILEGRNTAARARVLLAEGRRLAERTGDPHALALLTAIEGIAQATAGEFRAGARKLGEAVPLLRAHGSRWDVMNAEYLHLMYLSILGELAQLEERVRALEAEAVASQDRHTLANLRTGYPSLSRLVHGDVAGARALVDETLRTWSQHGFHRQHWFAVFSLANLDLYEGHGEDAWRRVTAVWRPLERSLLLRSRFVRIGAVYLRGRAALGSGRVHQARAAAAALEREAAWGRAVGLLLAASIDPSPQAFTHAAGKLDGCELRLHAAVARRRAGVDDPWWREQGVADPDALCRCFSPTR